MQDFNEFVNKNKNAKATEKPDGLDDNIFNMISSLASRFDGKNQAELLTAIYTEAKKGKKNGTLSNNDIDNFANMLSPLLDDKKKKMLFKVVGELKKI